MNGPRTEAGQRLLLDPSINGSASFHPHPAGIVDCWLCNTIRAIEAEAVEMALSDERLGAAIHTAICERFGSANCNGTHQFTDAALIRATLLNPLQPHTSKEETER